MFYGHNRGLARICARHYYLRLLLAKAPNDPICMITPAERDKLCSTTDTLFSKGGFTKKNGFHTTGGDETSPDDVDFVHDRGLFLMHESAERGAAEQSVSGFVKAFHFPRHWLIAFALSIRHVKQLHQPGAAAAASSFPLPLVFDDPLVLQLCDDTSADKPLPDLSVRMNRVLLHTSPEGVDALRSSCEREDASQDHAETKKLWKELIKLCEPFVALQKHFHCPAGPAPPLRTPPKLVKQRPDKLVQQRPDPIVID